MGRGGRHFGPEYHQDRVPVRDASIVEGHAVRQLYLTAGVTDLYLEAGDPALMAAMHRLWQDMTARKMHLTGGFGARFTGEAFGDPYELPSDRCYCETCAAIAAIMWNWRMLLATGDARYADLLERSLYNGFLSGVSLDGERYFYVNPLQSRGGIQRPEWYGCACCPPNVMRQIALVSHHVATVDLTGLQIHQYMAAQVPFADGEGRRALLNVDTNYPWDGDVRITVEESDDDVWRLSLRVPGWSTQGRAAVNGEPVAVALGGQYVELDRKWKRGDVVEFSLRMEPRLIGPNPRVDAIRGCLAIERGPLVYCLEAIDQKGSADLLDLRIWPDAAMEAKWMPDLLGGVTTIEAQGSAVDIREWDEHLYSPMGESKPRTRAAGNATLKAVPYYVWANRGPGAMRVWIPTAS
jgi:DUF1680 family protein